jgi:hypothetical protein
MKNMIAGIVAAAMLGMAAVSQGAEIFTEDFSLGMEGWTNAPGTNRFMDAGGYLRLTFPSRTIPLPMFAGVEAGPLASGGLFTGDYTATNIECIGLSFLAENYKPSDLLIEITSGDEVMYQDLAGRLNGVGGWNHFICPLVGPGSERWVGFPPATISGMTSNITRIAVRVMNNSSVSNQSFRLDDVFLAPLPAVAGFTFAPPNQMQVTWQHLRTNFTYRMEFAENPGAGSWSNITTIVATSSVQQITHTNAAMRPAAYRLVIP